jgi:hypothetical protein
LWQQPNGRFLRRTTLMVKALEALPFFTFPLDIPHDGIVEEKSVFLGPREAVTRRSERTRTCRGDPKGGPYVHVVHADHFSTDHMEIHRTERTAEIIAGLLQAPDLTTWRQSTAPDPGYILEP